MKFLLSILMVILAPQVWAGEKTVSSSPATVVKGEVLEVNDVESYTYLRLKTREGETWAAVGRSPVKKGAKVMIENVMAMSNFESKSLKRTFPTIVFGTLSGAAASVPGSGNAVVRTGNAPTPETVAIQVPKAGGANAYTVAEIITKSVELKDKSIRVRGKVVKFNAGIMGRNWVHLRDGSGSAADNTNDLLVTTAGETKVGNIVTAIGIVRTDKDFGSGYAYKVLVEEATLQE